MNKNEARRALISAFKSAAVAPSQPMNRTVVPSGTAPPPTTLAGVKTKSFKGSDVGGAPQAPSSPGKGMLQPKNYSGINSSLTRYASRIVEALEKKSYAPSGVLGLSADQKPATTPKAAPNAGGTRPVKMPTGVTTAKPKAPATSAPASQPKVTSAALCNALDKISRHMAETGLRKLSGIHDATRNVNSKATQKPTEPKVEKLESASDEKPKAAPKKKPEPEESENESEIEKEAGGGWIRPVPKRGKFSVGKIVGQVAQALLSGGKSAPKRAPKRAPKKAPKRAPKRAPKKAPPKKAPPKRPPTQVGPRPFMSAGAPTAAPTKAKATASTARRPYSGAPYAPSAGAARRPYMSSAPEAISPIGHAAAIEDILAQQAAGLPTPAGWSLREFFGKHPLLTAATGAGVASPLLYGIGSASGHGAGLEEMRQQYEPELDALLEALKTHKGEISNLYTQRGQMRGRVGELQKQLTRQQRLLEAARDPSFATAAAAKPSPPETPTKPPVAEAGTLNDLQQFLASIGGKGMSSIGKLLSAIGLESPGRTMEDWATGQEHGTLRQVAGGGGTILGVLLAYKLLQSLLGSGRD